MANYNLAPGVTARDVSELLEAAVEQSYKYSGAGSFVASYQTILSQIDRFGVNLVLLNTEKAGLTFITRPKLNLTTSALRQHAVMATLDSLDGQSLPFTTRCLLDTKFATTPKTISPIAATSPFVNNELPFITPLTNCLESISGFPDFVLDTETTEGGFFSEDQTFAKGADFLNRSYDLSLTFRDIQGGFIMSLLLYWELWIALAARGILTAYPEDIAARRYSYTCSIYRFVLDPSMRFITKWAKATGCFPKALPIGNSFNIGERESFLSSNLRFTVPFQANHIEYMDPRIFQDFNTLMSRYAPKNYATSSRFVLADNSPQSNFAGLPHIDTKNGTNEMQFFARKQELDDPLEVKIEEIAQRVDNRARALRTKESFRLRDDPFYEGSTQDL